KVDPLLGPLLKWTLRTNLANVEYVPSLTVPVNGSVFLIKNSNRENERIYQQELVKLGGESHLAFHGSDFSNFFSILANGYVMDRIAHGRIFGHGIYHSRCKYSTSP
ncbi:MAG: hypothetical protein SGCHY_004214, partial [Lobulomycetales sp.]